MKKITPLSCIVNKGNRLFILCAIVFVALFAGVQNASAQCPFYYKVPVTITNLGSSEQSGYQISDTINTAALISAGKMQANGSDIRFTDSLGKNLPYWIESGINTNSTIIWIKTDTIFATGTTTIYLTYGNPTHYAAANNGDSTFLLFDGFDSTVLNTAKWTSAISKNSSINVGGGRVAFSSENYATLVSKATFSYPFLSEINVTSAADSWPSLYQLDSGNFNNGMGLALDGENGTMYLANSYAISPTYGANQPYGSASPGTVTGVWSVVRGPSSFASTKWPGGRLSANPVPAPQARQQNAFGLLASGAANMQVDWFRARQYYAAGVSASAGTEVSAPYTVLYVDSSVAASGNGGNWATAFKTVQEALVAASGCSNIDSILVAKGTYQPASGQSFSMLPNVKILGGYPTGGGTRNRQTDTTILEGNGSSVISNDNNGLTATAILDGFTITGGNATNYGGGIYNNSSSPTVTNCIFSRNSATAGGGMTNYQYSNPIVVNCTFSGNSTSGNGGGIFNNNYSNPTIINCSFSGNSASSNGGGMFNNNYSNPTITNCIIYGNSSGIDNSSSTPAVTYSLVQGIDADAANHNIDGSTDPKFANAPSYAAAPFIGGDYTLQHGSPCINTGINDSLPAGDALDLAGNARIVENIVDMGAYEYQGSVLAATLLSFTGRLQNGIANLQWTTGVESNFKGFEIQKAVIASDAGAWQSQGFVAAKGSNSSYSFSIPQAVPIAYYRLKLEDNDGNAKYSNTIMLSQSNSVIALYPSPAKTSVTVNVVKAGSIRIYSESGQLVKTQALQAGANTVDISSLSAGTYYGVVGGEKVKFVKE